MNQSSYPYRSDKLKKVFSKDYEFRNQLEHQLAFSFLSQYFSTLASSTVKLISFYIELIQRPFEQFNQEGRKLEHGLLINVSSSERQQANGQSNPESHAGYFVVNNNQKSVISNEDQAQFSLYITYDNYLSAIALGETSIQEQLQFFNSSQYLCSMPRKKYFTLMRNSKVLQYTHRQMIYFEGQLISPGQSGSGVYIVRHGQMTYAKKIDGSNVQVYRFGSGHLIGTLELETPTKNRIFSVKCKSSRCVVYQISQQFFTSFVKPYCQSILTKKQKKLEKFLQQKSTQLSEFRNNHKEFNISLRRSYSNTNQINTERLRNTQSISMFTSRDLPSLIRTSKHSSDIQAEELRKTSYLGLKYDGPLKHYPMTSQRSKFTQSEFKDLEKLVLKNEKINKIRQIKKNQTDETKESILFKLFQGSWKFEKLKKTRYN